MYVEAGMTPLQAIQSATLVAARLLRMETKIGKVAPGILRRPRGRRGRSPEGREDDRVAAFRRLKEGRAVLDRRSGARGFLRSSRAMTIRWISDVPSPIVQSFTSR